MSNIGAIVANKLPSAANSGSAGTSAVKFVDTTSSAAVIVLPIPGSNKLKNSAFRVIAQGRVTTAGAYTYLATLYYSTSATVASGDRVALQSALTLTSATRSWRIEADFIWDSTSSVLTGRYNTIGGADTSAVVSNTIATTEQTSVDLSTEGLGFTVGITFGTGSASNAAYLDRFELIPQ